MYLIAAITLIAFALVALLFFTVFNKRTEQADPVLDPEPRDDRRPSNS